MKNFFNSASLFAKHGANITFRLLMAFTLLLSATTFIPEMQVLLLPAALIVVAFYVFTVSFNGKRSASFQGLAAVTQADLFNVTALQKKDIVLNAIYNHYSWEKDVNGEWIKGGNGRDFPFLSDDMRIVRHDLYFNQYLTIGTQEFDFFLQQGAANSIESNFDFATLPPNKLFVLFGILSELATGASVADTSDILLFNVPTLAADAPVLNSQITFKINAKEVITRNPYKSLFVNDDAMKGYHRFEQPIVWEPGGQIQLHLKLAKAYGAAVWRYKKFSLAALELTV
jgi:hypothetical protein